MRAKQRAKDIDHHTDGGRRSDLRKGEIVGIHPQKDPIVCPIVLLRRYLEVSELKAGPLFRRIDHRSDAIGNKPLTLGVIGRMVKAYCEAAGIDPERYSSHSLRAGFVTTAAAKGVTLHNIMRQTRHKDQRVAMTLHPSRDGVRKQPDARARG